MKKDGELSLEQLRQKLSLREAYPIRFLRMNFSPCFANFFLNIVYFSKKSTCLPKNSFLKNCEHLSINKVLMDFAVASCSKV